MKCNQTKKKNAGLTALVALLLIITTIASGIGIYAWAKYTSSHNGETTAAVAKWNFNVNLKKGQQNIVLGTEPLDLATTLDSSATHIADGKIAPGTTGTFDIEINTTGTEVDLEYVVEISLENCPRNITFSKKGPGEQNFTEISTAKTGDETERTRTGIAFSKYVTSGQNGVFTETIKWDWPYELTGNDPTTNQPYTAEQKEAYDTRDNQDQGRTVTMNITVTGTEMLGDSNANTVQGQAKAGNIKPGDWVNYNPGTLTTDTIDLPAGARTQELDYTLGTIDASLSGNWQVLDVNTTTGEVLIIPTKYSSTRLRLEGIDGYNNAIQALNAVSQIYLNPTYATSARSLTVDDVNKREGKTGEYAPAGNATSDTWKCRYGQGTSEDVNDPGNIIDSESDAPREEQPSRTYTSTAKTGKYSYSTSYFSNMTCWLASRCLDIDFPCCDFNVRYLSDGDVISGYLSRVYSYGGAIPGWCFCPVVPVVTLKSNIPIEKDENDVWILDGDTTYHNSDFPKPEPEPATASATE